MPLNQYSPRFKDLSCIIFRFDKMWDNGRTSSGQNVLHPGNISRYFVKSVEVFLFFLALIVADCDELHYCMSQKLINGCSWAKKCVVVSDLSRY